MSGLVTGAGSSPSHIIITGILGVVPGVGQAMDIRDLVIGIITIARAPLSVSAWVSLVITLIGCIPALGDALKVGFKLMKQGHNFGRVLEGVSPTLRGNVEKYMRKIDWKVLADESKSLFSKTISAFISGLDTWVVKTMAGRSTITHIVNELKALQKQGPKMIDEAISELKRMHAKMMGHQLPGTTAATSAAATRAASNQADDVAAEVAKKSADAAKAATAAARAERKLLASKSRDVRNNRVTPNSTKNSVKKKGQPRKQKWRSGVPAEHITEYSVKKKHSNFRKAINHGKLTEEYSPRRNGLDHLWSNKTDSVKPFVVGETKSSIFDAGKLLAALPADMQAQFAALRAEEAANPTSNNNKPNIFHSEGRDAVAGKRVTAGGSATDELAVRRGVNPPDPETGLFTQMSHEWIVNCVRRESTLTQAGETFEDFANQYIDGQIECPYQRWIALVTGRQLHKHSKSGGQLHEIQTTLTLPDNILRR